MSDDLVKRLRKIGERVAIPCPDNIKGCAVFHFQIETDATCKEAADRIEELEAKLAKADAHRATLARTIKNQRKEIKSIQYHVRCLKSILKKLGERKNE